MRISFAESVLMEVLWRKSPVPSEEIAAEVCEANGWTPSTVRTLLNRLLNKGAVEAVRKGRQYLYRPRLERSAYVLAESRGLLDRLFDGRVSPLVAHLSEHQTLSAEDVAELKSLIARIEDAG